MTEDHYTGFWVEWYDELSGSGGQDVECYRDLLKKSSQPILELACGTGRMLIEFLKEGMDVDGVDMAPAMIARCRAKLDQAGLKSSLYIQSIEDMSLPRKYRTIFITGSSFQHIPDRETAMRALENIYNHLEPGGKFLIDLFIPFDDIVDPTHDQLIERWSASRGNRKLVVKKSSHFDLRNQKDHQTYVYELFERNKLFRSATDQADIVWYGVKEFEFMLGQAGFIQITSEPFHPGNSPRVVTLFTAFRIQ